MAIRNILTEPDETLRKKSKPVKEVNDHIRQLIDDMHETMVSADGVGLAAPQVGVLRQVVVLRKDEESFIDLVNPEIITTEGEQTGEEGCLSVPGKFGTVTRPSYVKVSACNEQLQRFEIEGRDLLARALCHEIDHLEGHLYTEIAEGPLMTVAPPEEEEE